MLVRPEYVKIMKGRRTPVSASRALNFALYQAMRPLLPRAGLKRLPYSPVSVFVWVTTRCSKTCGFCPYSGELNQAPLLDDLTFEGFQKLLDHWALRRNLHIGFYGGEPLLNRDLFKMIRLSKKRGMISTLTTNGRDLARRSDELKRDFPDLLTISYYPEDHELIEPSLSRITRNSVTRLNFILSRDTITHAERALETAIRNDFDLFGLDSISDSTRRHDQVIWSDSEEFAALRDRLLRLSRGSRIRIKWPDARRQPRKAPCGFFWDTIYLRADGSVGPCCEWRLRDYRPGQECGWNEPWYLKQREGILSGEFANDRCPGCIYGFDNTMGV